jgi:hypothetical protein
MIKKWVLYVLVFCAVLFVFWCGVVDFDRRDWGLSFSMVCAIYAALLAYVFFEE